MPWAGGKAMERREFITALGLAAIWPLAARAQNPMPAVGFLGSGSPDAFAQFLIAFREGLKDSGFTDPNVSIEYRWAEGHYDRLPALAAELVGRRVTTIVASGLPAAVAAKATTSTIPIVFVMGSDPVKYGLVANLSRPNANVTGISFLANVLLAKQLELQRELVPRSAILAVLLNPNSPNIEFDTKDVQSAADSVGQKLLVLKAAAQGDLQTAFAGMIQQRASALLVGGDALFTSHRDQLVALAARYSIPVIYYSREFVVAGGLASYGTSYFDAYRQAGIYSGRILAGAKPADLPVIQPTKFELVINLKTAKTLGLTIPQALLATADEVIE